MARRKNRRNIRRLLFWTILILAVLLLVYVLQNKPQEKENTPDGAVYLYFADIGQGDASLVVAPEGTVLIDAGLKDTKEALYHLLAEQGDTLTYLVITHPHDDHIGAATYILEQMDVENILLPIDTSGIAAYKKFLAAVEEEGAVVKTADAGMTFSLGEVDFTCLAPLADTDDKNENSTVIRLDYGSFSALYTGDAGSKSEKAQLAFYGSRAGGVLDVDLLKVGHHGSRYSSIETYLSAVTPEYAVIMCGEGNSYGHPHEEALERLEDVGAEIFRTDEGGTVVVTVIGEAVTVGYE